ncbi:terminase small subunit [Methylomonas sp. 11b]|uniref:terminase small subunit n=1 Tax=Methylomonas sp. 11b TaxID=1168169 RepID=UPI0004BA3FC6|nr:terminase small subunit [Methylomonas sp. 11b]
MKIVTPDMTLDELREMVSDREYQFCLNMLLTVNQTKAAIDAGFSEKTARQQATRLVTTRPEIRRILALLRAEREDRLQIRQDNVLRHVGYIAFADPRKAYDENNRLLPPSEWPDEIAFSISAIKTTELRDAEGNLIGHTNEIKFWSKSDAQLLAARHLGMLNDKVEVSMADKLVERLARLNDRSS